VLVLLLMLAASAEEQWKQSLGARAPPERLNACMAG
jgi:hypothetical protein